MTFIQPNKNTSVIPTAVLLFLSALFVAAAIFLVILYNRFVNLEHGVLGMKLQLKAIQAQNVEIEDKIFTLIDSSKSERVSLGKLVPDKNPKYFEVNSKWSYASQY